MLLYSVVQNNVNKDPPQDIIQGLIAIASVFKNQTSNRIIFTSGILLLTFSVNRLIVTEVNVLLKCKCSVKNFHFINQSNEWVLNNFVC